MYAINLKFEVYLIYRSDDWSILVWNKFGMLSALDFRQFVRGKTAFQCLRAMEFFQLSKLHAVQFPHIQPTFLQ